MVMMTAESIPGTDRVQCKCGWQGTTEDLEDKTCPICGEAFRAIFPRQLDDEYPFNMDLIRKT